MLAIIGGSGLSQFASLEVTQRQLVSTPYGEPSGTLTFGRVCGRPVVFLARHGDEHTIPPHQVNYRAKHLGLAGVWRGRHRRGGGGRQHSCGPPAWRSGDPAPDHRLHLGASVDLPRRVR
jgi:hypothetical protein